VGTATRHNTTTSGLDRYLYLRQNACDRMVLLNVAVPFGFLRSQTPTNATLGLMAVHLHKSCYTATASVNNDMAQRFESNCQAHMARSFRHSSIAEACIMHV